MKLTQRRFTASIVVVGTPLAGAGIGTALAGRADDQRAAVRTEIVALEQQQHGMADALAASMGTSRLQLGLQRAMGMSPAEIGASVGVSRDALVAAAESGLRSELPDGQSSLSDDQITQVAQTVVDTVNPGS